MTSPEIARFLRAIADVIEEKSPAEIKALTKALTTSQPGRPKKAVREKGDKIAKAPDLVSIAGRIFEATDRATAKSVLDGENLARRDLLKLAQQHNVHVVKEDTVEIIETKIVEALVGSRLSSKAIRGD